MNSLRLIPVLVLCALSAAAQSPIATDGSLGAEVDVGPGTDSLGNPADYLIGADLGQLSGDNLFHSFARFGIGTGETATFDGPASIRNVIARVTGGDPSSIDGWLRSTMPLADVWLLNPSGIVFGENAQLDVPGSFHAATADYLGFEPDGERFYASPLQLSSILSAAQPSAFGFLPETIAASPIEVNGATLSVQPGATLELAGGDITLTSADLVADAGTILLRGGRIVVEQDSHVLARNFDATPGRIDVDGSDSVLVDNSLLSVNTSGSGNAGTIDIASPTVTFRHGPLDFGQQIPSEAAVGASAETSSSGAGGMIAIDAGSLALTDGVEVSTKSYGPAATGNAGTVDIQADTLEVSRRSLFNVGAYFSPSDAGALRIDADRLTLNGTGGFALLYASGNGGVSGTIDIRSNIVELVNGGAIHVECFDCSTRAGDITIAARSISMESGGNISANTYGSGGGGDITINAAATVAMGSGFISSSTYGSGNGGNITLNAESVTIRVGSIASNTYGSGKGGNITLDVADTVEITTRGSITSYSPGGAGDAGNIKVTAGNSILLDGAGDPLFTLVGALTQAWDGTIISAATFGGGGAGGSVSLEAGDITLTNGAFVTTATVGGGEAGPVEIRGDRIQILNGAFVDSSSLPLFLHPSFPPGLDAGSVTIVAGESIEVVGHHPIFGDAARVSAYSLGSGAGGTVTLSAPRILLDDGGAIATGGHALLGVEGRSGGDIDITTDELLLTDGGRIDASTSIHGPGGNIEVNANSIEVSGTGSAIATRTGAEGTGGTVTLNAARIEIANGGEISAESTTNLFAKLDDLTSDEKFRGVPLFAAPDPSRSTGSAGSITIEARDLVHLDDGTISSSVGSASGGDITIDPTFVILEHGSQIVATAGTGTGGHIRIDADHFFAFPGSVVSAASGNPELSGTVEIASPDVDLAGSLTALPSTFLDAASQMQQRCAARRGGERAGSFAVRGAGGIPAEPDGWLPAPVLADESSVASVPGPLLASAACP